MQPRAGSPADGFLTSRSPAPVVSSRRAVRGASASRRAATTSAFRPARGKSTAWAPPPYCFRPRGSLRIVFIIILGNFRVKREMLYQGTRPAGARSPRPGSGRALGRPGEVGEALLAL